MQSYSVPSSPINSIRSKSNLQAPCLVQSKGISVLGTTFNPTQYNSSSQLQPQQQQQQQSQQQIQSQQPQQQPYQFVQNGSQTNIPQQIGIMKGQTIYKNNDSKQQFILDQKITLVNNNLPQQQLSNDINQKNQFNGVQQQVSSNNVIPSQTIGQQQLQQQQQQDNRNRFISSIQNQSIQQQQQPQVMRYSQLQEQSKPININNSNNIYSSINNNNVNSNTQLNHNISSYNDGNITYSTNNQTLLNRNNQFISNTSLNNNTTTRGYSYNCKSNDIQNNSFINDPINDAIIKHEQKLKEILSTNNISTFNNNNTTIGGITASNGKEQNNIDLQQSYGGSLYLSAQPETSNYHRIYIVNNSIKVSPKKTVFKTKIKQVKSSQDNLRSNVQGQQQQVYEQYKIPNISQRSSVQQRSSSSVEGITGQQQQSNTIRFQQIFDNNKYLSNNNNNLQSQQQPVMTYNIQEQNQPLNYQSIHENNINDNKQSYPLESRQPLLQSPPISYQQFSQNLLNLPKIQQNQPEQMISQTINLKLQNELKQDEKDKELNQNNQIQKISDYSQYIIPQSQQIDKQQQFKLQLDNTKNNLFDQQETQKKQQQYQLITNEPIKINSPRESAPLSPINYLYPNKVNPNEQQKQFDYSSYSQQLVQNNSALPTNSLLNKPINQDLIKNILDNPQYSNYSTINNNNVNKKSNENINNNLLINNKNNNMDIVGQTPQQQQQQQQQQTSPQVNLKTMQILSANDQLIQQNLQLLKQQSQKLLQDKTDSKQDLHKQTQSPLSQNLNQEITTYPPPYTFIKQISPPSQKIISISPQQRSSPLQQSIQQTLTTHHNRFKSLQISPTQNNNTTSPPSQLIQIQHQINRTANNSPIQQPQSQINIIQSFTIPNQSYIPKIQTSLLSPTSPTPPQQQQQSQLSSRLLESIPSYTPLLVPPYKGIENPLINLNSYLNSNNNSNVQSRANSQDRLSPTRNKLQENIEQSKLNPQQITQSQLQTQQQQQVIPSYNQQNMIIPPIISSTFTSSPDGKQHISKISVQHSTNTIPNNPVLFNTSVTHQYQFNQSDIQPIQQKQQQPLNYISDTSNFMRIQDNFILSNNSSASSQMNTNLGELEKSYNNNNNNNNNIEKQLKSNNQQQIPYVDSESDQIHDILNQIGKQPYQQDNKTVVGIDSIPKVAGSSPQIQNEQIIPNNNAQIKNILPTGRQLFSDEVIEEADSLKNADDEKRMRAFSFSSKEEGQSYQQGESLQMQQINDNVDQLIGNIFKDAFNKVNENIINKRSEYESQSQSSEHNHSNQSQKPSISSNKDSQSVKNDMKDNVYLSKNLSSQNSQEQKVLQSNSINNNDNEYNYQNSNEDFIIQTANRYNNNKDEKLLKQINFSSSNPKEKEQQQQEQELVVKVDESNQKYNLTKQNSNNNIQKNLNTINEIATDGLKIFKKIENGNNFHVAMTKDQKQELANSFNKPDSLQQLMIEQLKQSKQQLQMNSKSTLTNSQLRKSNKGSQNSLNQINISNDSFNKFNRIRNNSNTNNPLQDNIKKLSNNNSNNNDAEFFKVKKNVSQDKDKQEQQFSSSGIFEKKSIDQINKSLEKYKSSNHTSNNNNSNKKEKKEFPFFYANQSNITKKHTSVHNNNNNNNENSLSRQRSGDNHRNMIDRIENTFEDQQKSSTIIEDKSQFSFQQKQLLNSEEKAKKLKNVKSITQFQPPYPSSAQRQYESNHNNNIKGSQVKSNSPDIQQFLSSSPAHQPINPSQLLNNNNSDVPLFSQFEESEKDRKYREFLLKMLSNYKEKKDEIMKKIDKLNKKQEEEYQQINGKNNSPLRKLSSGNNNIPPQKLTYITSQGMNNQQSQDQETVKKSRKKSDSIPSHIVNDQSSTHLSKKSFQLNDYLGYVFAEKEQKDQIQEYEFIQDNDPQSPSRRQNNHSDLFKNTMLMNSTSNKKNKQQSDSRQNSLKKNKIQNQNEISPKQQRKLRPCEAQQFLEEIQKSHSPQKKQNNSLGKNQNDHLSNIKQKQRVSPQNNKNVKNQQNLQNKRQDRNINDIQNQSNLKQKTAESINSKNNNNNNILRNKQQQQNPIQQSKQNQQSSKNKSITPPRKNMKTNQNNQIYNQRKPNQKQQNQQKVITNYQFEENQSHDEINTSQNSENIIPLSYQQNMKQEKNKKQQIKQQSVLPAMTSESQTYHNKDEEQQTTSQKQNKFIDINNKNKNSNSPSKFHIQNGKTKPQQQQQYNQKALSKSPYTRQTQNQQKYNFINEHQNQIYNNKNEQNVNQIQQLQSQNKTPQKNIIQNINDMKMYSEYMMANNQNLLRELDNSVENNHSNRFSKNSSFYSKNNTNNNNSTNSNMGRSIIKEIGSFFKYKQDQEKQQQQQSRSNSASFNNQGGQFIEDNYNNDGDEDDDGDSPRIQSSPERIHYNINERSNSNTNQNQNQLYVQIRKTIHSISPPNSRDQQNGNYFNLPNYSQKSTPKSCSIRLKNKEDLRGESIEMNEQNNNERNNQKIYISDNQKQYQQQNQKQIDLKQIQNIIQQNNQRLSNNLQL